MSTKEVKEILEEVFETDSFWVGEYLDRTANIQVLDFWWAQIIYFHHRQPPLVVVVNTNQGKKGMLYVPYDPSVTPPHWEEPSSYKAVLLDVSQWEDPVREALHEVDLAPARNEVLYYGHGNYRYSLHMETEISSSSLMFAGFTENIKLMGLWRALQEVVFNFVEMSQDNYIEHYVDTWYDYTNYRRNKQSKMPGYDAGE